MIFVAGAKILRFFHITRGATTKQGVRRHIRALGRHAEGLRRRIGGKLRPTPRALAVNRGEAPAMPRKNARRGKSFMLIFGTRACGHVAIKSYLCKQRRRKIHEKTVPPGRFARIQREIMKIRLRNPLLP